MVVLGGSGFIGSHLIDTLNNAGIDNASVSSRQIDLSDRSAVLALADHIRPDDTLVFISCVTRDKGDDPATLMKNLVMAQHVGLFLEEYGCAHLIYLSSDAVFKDDIALVTEDSERDPGGMYGLAHVVRERMMQHCCAKLGTPWAILRPCGVYGPGDTHNGYGPNRFLRTALAEGKISLFGDGEEKRDHIFVEDVCRVVIECATHRSTGILNLATGAASSFAQVAKVVARVVDRPVEIVHLPRRTPITHRHFDVTAVLKTFPTFAFVPLEEGLHQTVRALPAQAR